MSDEILSQEEYLEQLREIISWQEEAENEKNILDVNG